MSLLLAGPSLTAQSCTEGATEKRRTLKNRLSCSECCWALYDAGWMESETWHRHTANTVQLLQLTEHVSPKVSNADAKQGSSVSCCVWLTAVPAAGRWLTVSLYDEAKVLDSYQPSARLWQSQAPLIAMSMCSWF